MEFRAHRYSQLKTQAGKDETIVAIFVEKDLPLFLEVVKNDLLNDYWDEFEKHSPQSIEPEKKTEFDTFCENCDTVLNTDPFGKKLDGHKLGEIFLNNLDWVTYAKNNLKNKFIAEKLLAIEKYQTENPDALRKWKNGEKNDIKRI